MRKMAWKQVFCALSQNQQMHKFINTYKMYLQPLHMFRQVNCHPQGVFIKELQALIASKYSIAGFTSICSSLINAP
jgi:hypothetical protein